MYNRIRSIDDYFEEQCTVTENAVEEYSVRIPGFCSPSVTKYQNVSDLQIPHSFHVGTISDVVTPRRAKWDRFSVQRKNLPKASQPVHHVSKKLIVVKDDITFITHRRQQSGGCWRDDTKTTQTSGLAWLTRRYGPGFVKAYALDEVPSTLGGELFTGADWFDLSSQFNEACESLIPSSFFAGESFVEGDIYLNAIKTVISPKKAVKAFFADVSRRGLRRFSLGELDKHYFHLFHNKLTKVVDTSNLQFARDLAIPKELFKEGINAHLLYKFGVRPAISDIRSSIAAHSVVSKQLDRLSSNAGQYIPIRVRQVRKDAPAAYGSLGGLLRVNLELRQKMSVFVISALGRVREDINKASKWRAYAEYFGLNKVVGTAWELIPFSFVVDWFTNAQERLNDLTRLRLGEGPFMNIASLSSSVKNSLIYEYVLYPGLDETDTLTMTSPSSPTPLLRVEVSDYLRSPYIPDTSGVVDISALGLFHASTFGELLIQKFL